MTLSQGGKMSFLADHQNYMGLDALDEAEEVPEGTQLGELLMMDKSREVAMQGTMQHMVGLMSMMLMSLQGIMMFGHGFQKPESNVF